MSKLRAMAEQNEIKLSEPVITRAEALDAFNELRRQAADVPDMSLDEINKEICLAREVRKNHNLERDMYIKDRQPYVSEKDGRLHFDMEEAL